ncbi:hypothetical protein BSK59_28905 [Paenibacillus odorifer]|uniref:GIY-YIG domain-containing protein n=1 Tax=Paenibacillus odorifer TaxID=189426 RepID=A0ABX3GRU1_9BACL|nr:GIY-YIG nuclease family protein [Paenibacillus odorifer]OMD35129.1 hypothetical protein BSO21_09620 [Paenibacillus odorifer]OME46865.1 hypothetical protein BSK59_28905 [Paenibacillus odorifer]
MADTDIVMRSVYILELEDQFIYVGESTTDDLDKRIRKHGTKKGAEWTKIHKPKAVIEVISAGCCDRFAAKKLEDQMTLKYMAMHGWSKVRGGKYSITDDLLLYSKLCELKKQRHVDFVVEKPDTVPPLHQPRIYSGVNRRSGEKPKNFIRFSEQIRAKIKMSIGGWFEANTQHFNKALLLQINNSDMSISWLTTKGYALGVNDEDLKDISAQIEYLKIGKVSRVI